MTGAQAIQGVPAAPGVAHGPYLRYERVPLTHDGRTADNETEVMRLKAACELVAESRERVAEELRRSGHGNEARIFDAHAEMARDPALLDDAIARITSSGLSASSAIAAASSTVAEQLRALDDATLAGRASDVLDVGDRIARELAGLPAATIDLVVPSIVVADDLPPSLTATLPRDLLLAIVLEGSSPTAHAAILARAYGIPAVVGASRLRETLGRVGPQAHLAVDGATGEVIVAPDASTIAAFDVRGRDNARDRAGALADAELPAVTLDGTVVRLLANIGSPSESAAARAFGASGVGLLRTEFLFLERRTAPTEDEQADVYGEVAAAFAPEPVTVRLLDVGGDKPISYLPMPREENPFLGQRALRLAGTYRELFVAQLRACYRAATRGRVKVMAPMVADATDARLFLDLAREARASLGASGDVDLGVMLEIPSAVLCADTYFDRLSFASLGTNDLLQYTLAADRGNAALERYRDALHPAHLALIRLAVDAARRHDVELSVCGEMAGDPVAALALVGLGVRHLSMTPRSMPTVKRAIRAVSLADLEHEARAALTEASAELVRARFDRLASLRAE
ncbi:MAG TPA: phosphoenolpyruvate--protein phosphotransferase [Candidatus Limnocylindria bacterium]|nr:phosphoenolpyruvate--protein phosphotransferase [Candidatus Limnocylindria bacterium]